ncbi:MAG: branched-chain amino acid ABC transporter permease [Acidimicrobiia bacterium]
MAIETPTRGEPGETGETVEPGPSRFRPSPLGIVARAILWAAIAWLVLVFPLSREDAILNRYNEAVAFAIIGLSLNVLIGYVGQISLGHQAFVGIGAFTSAYVVTEQNLSFWVGVAAAAVVGGLQALVLGGVSLRITGLYFALVTLSYGLVAEKNIFEIQEFTGGGLGQPAPKPDWFETDLRYFYLCLAFLALVLWIDWRMMRTKSGRALLALRENPRVASTFGVNVRLMTLFAFMVSGAFAGLGGALLAHQNTRVSPSVFEFRLALVFIIMTVVGGLRSRVGVVIGSAFFALLDLLLERRPMKWLIDPVLDWIPGAPDLSPAIGRLVIGPVLLLLTLTLYPGGIGQQIRPVVRWLSGHRFDLKDRGLKEVQISDVRA